MVFEEVELEPKASALIESLRDMGYSLKTAIADVIDNSITANAKTIDILADTHTQVPAIGIVDDGCGMTREELLEAMRPGYRNPQDARPADDLGRFGLGLKTASFSQCRRMTVFTRKNGVATQARWDLDKVAERNKWVVEVIDTERDELVRWSDCLKSDGTLVVWEKLDRIVSEKNKSQQKNFIQQLDEVATHLEFVFHRFIEASRNKKINLSLNSRPLQAFDPFNRSHPATQHHPEEVIIFKGNEIRVKPVTLPHHDKVEKEEWQKLAGPEGYTSNQGFYLYRNHRLILHGTWFRLARQLETTKLARVSIDIPNSLDEEWKIDVKKSYAQPPISVRNRLSKVIQQLGLASRRTYQKRGAKVTSKNRMPIWQRYQKNNIISYDISSQHPIIVDLKNSLDSGQLKKFDQLLKLISISLPIESLQYDFMTKPEDLDTPKLDKKELRLLVLTTWNIIKDQKYDKNDFVAMFRYSEPFKTHWNGTISILEELE